jgi:hypothetical protein
MKISELIEVLQERQQALGDCEVLAQTEEGHAPILNVESKISGTELVVLLDTIPAPRIEAAPVRTMHEL